MTTPSVPGYSLQQAQREIAALRGQIAHLAASTELLNLIVDTSLTAPDGAVWTSAGISKLEMAAQGSTPSGAPVLYADSAGNLSYNSLTGINTHVVQSLADITGRTVSGTTSDTQFSGSLAIPANDGQVSTTYRVRLYGNGTQATTTGVNFTFGIHGFGQAPENGSRTGISGGVGITAGSAFTFFAEGIITILTTGASGTARFAMTGQAGANGRSSATSLPMQGVSGTVTVDTTASTSMFLSCQLSSTTGSPTISGIFSTLERLGT